MYSGYSKFEVEKDLVDHMAQTLPSLAINGGMGAFGLHPSVSSKLAINLYGPKAYDKTEFIESLKPLTKAGGTTPLGDGINVSMEALKDVQGDIALIVFSDGMETSPKGVAAVKALKDVFGDRLCVYTVWVGNEPQGKARMEALAEAGGCGFASTADELLSAEGMAAFVEQIFLKEAPPQPAPAAAPKITWILSDVNFDFNKWDLRPDAKETLSRDLAILKENPQIKVEIQGHTCDLGDAKYNQMLSEKRAQSVMNYLVENGIDPARLTAKGYGEERPRFPNDSEENRARNRRVEMVPFE
jgi:OOP family OmpA-OmpF porin